MPDLRRRRLPRRLIQLYAGLVTFAFSEALIVQAQLGVMSWDVLHQGLSRQFGLTIGQWSIIVGALVLFLWIPMREKPGVGTLSNVLVIGPCLDFFLGWVPAPTSIGWRVAMLSVGIVINGVATAAYIGARLGPGPRDGLMTGLVRLTRRPVGWIRTAIELSVVVFGFLLGGNLGAGTVLFVFTIGPIVHVFLPRLIVRQPVPDHDRDTTSEPSEPSEPSKTPVTSEPSKTPVTSEPSETPVTSEAPVTGSTEPPAHTA
jgi:uncharacterized membrane protein YczE